MSRFTSFIDTLQSTLFVIIAILMFTGGFVYKSDTAKLELSQVDSFAISLFILSLIRKKLAGDFFSEPVRKFNNFLYDLFNNNSKFTLLTSTGTYFFIMIWVQVWRYDSFHANAYDLGYVNQSIYCTGRCFDSLKESFLHSTLSVNSTYLGEHFSPILALFSPLYSLWNSIYLIFFIQTLFLSAGALLIYRISRLYQVNRGISAALSSCYLMYQPLRAANIFDFREDNLFIVLILLAVYFMITTKMVLFWISILLTLLVKENAGILTALLGMIIVLSRDLFPLSHGRHAVPPSSGRHAVPPWPLWTLSRKHGCALILISISAFWFINHTVTPYFSGSASQTRLAFRIGNTAFSENGGIFNFMIQHPVMFIEMMLKNLFQKPTAKYFLVVFIPFIVAIRYSPLPMLAAGLLFMLHVFLGITTVGFHYECALIPFAFLGMMQTARKMNFNFGLLLLSFMLFYGRSPVLSLREFSPSDHDVMVKEEISKIPASASISTQSSLHPHFTRRRIAKLFSGVADTDYIVVDFSEDKSLYGTPNIAKDVEAINLTGNSSEYNKIVDRDQFQIFKKKQQKL